MVLASLMYMPIFGHLNTLPIRLWDEAQLAINAFEMKNDGHFIVTYFGGNPDMWNTKPPLLIWFQVALIHVIGLNELAIRIPSAIAAFLTCILLLIISIRFFQSFWFGFIAILVLITSEGYINIHVTRTGDYDALLTLFTTLSGLCFFVYCESKKEKHLYYFFIFTALAVLTKSVAGLLFLPAFAIYSIVQKQFIPLLKNRNFYFGLCLFLFMVGWYYILREFKNPGYLAAVWKNELAGRYLSVIEEHKHGNFFYFDNLIKSNFTAWYLLIPCGLLIAITIKEQIIRRLALFAFLACSTYLIIISAAQTKLPWYDAPLYPFLSIIIAIFIYFVFQMIDNLGWINQRLSLNIAPFIFLFLLFFNPYQKTFNYTYTPKEDDASKYLFELSYFLRDAANGKHNLDNHYVLYDGFNTHYLFYLKVLNGKGINISFKDWKQLEAGDLVIAQQQHIKQYVEENYKFESSNLKQNVVKYNIYGKPN